MASARPRHSINCFRKSVRGVSPLGRRRARPEAMSVGAQAKLPPEVLAMSWSLLAQRVYIEPALELFGKRNLRAVCDNE